MNFIAWIKSLRKAVPATAAAIRRELDSLQQQHKVTTQQRDHLALDAVNDEAASLRWLRLDGTAVELERRISVLEAALPQAEARETEAAAQAQAAARLKSEQEYARKIVEAQAWLDELLARLPTGAELTRARDLREALGTDASHLRRWSNALSVRRPLDPLLELSTAMQWRVDRIARSRWIGSLPITLEKKGTGTNG